MPSEVEQATSVIGDLSLSDITSWDEHYDNPKADIILVSSNMVGFRVDAWQFKKESAFIRDLITFPSDQALESSPIELDHNTVGSIFKEKVDQALLVAIELRVQHRLDSKGLDPWAVFRLAAARDHPELARASIRAFECAQLSHSSIYVIDVSKFAGISGSYVGGLMLAGYNIQHSHNNRNNTWTETIECRKWSEVADYFHVK